MRKITGQFTKYTVILLIVGAILVLAGGLSVGRKAIANQREVALDMSARTRVDVISKENSRLKKDILEANTEKENAEKKVKVALSISLAQKYLNENDLDKVKAELEKVDLSVLETMEKEFKELYDEIMNEVK